MKLHDRLQTTFIYVTHDQSEAMQMGKRVVVMNEGRVYQIGTPQQVYDNPRCVFVAGFIGSPKMNFFASYIFNNGKELYTEVLGTKVVLDCKRFIDLEACFEKRKVIIGIRPGDFEISESAEGIAARVVRSVPMGARVHVECEADGNRLVEQVTKL